MFLFYTSKVEGKKVLLDDVEHLHCTKVLRKKMGDNIFVTDGKGFIYNCKVSEIGKKTTVCDIMDTITKETPSPKITIAIAPTKNAARLEWFVEKAVEIGLSNICFVHTKRTESKNVNLDRIHKIIIAAIKQSMNVHSPGIHVYQNLNDLLQTTKDDTSQKFIAHCEGPTDLLNEVADKLSDTLLLIGPEGDFTPEEIKMAATYGFKSVSLGNSRLRTETAGIVGLMMVR